MDIMEIELINTILSFPAPLADYIEPAVHELAEMFRHLDCPLDGMLVNSAHCVPLYLYIIFRL